MNVTKHIQAQSNFVNNFHRIRQVAIRDVQCRLLLLSFALSDCLLQLKKSIFWTQRHLYSKSHQKCGPMKAVITLRQVCQYNSTPGQGLVQADLYIGAAIYRSVYYLLSQSRLSSLKIDDGWKYQHYNLRLAIYNYYSNFRLPLLHRIRQWSNICRSPPIEQLPFQNFSFKMIIRLFAAPF